MEKDSLPQRKRIRLPEFNYSENRMYFVTICTKEKERILGRVVGYGACDVPQMTLSDDGKIVEKYIRLMDNKYNNVFVDSYIIMPNHIHMIITVSHAQPGKNDEQTRVGYFGMSQAPYPTDNVQQKTKLSSGDNRANEIIPKFVSLLKRYCNHTIGYNIWQRRYFDRVIRNYNEYLNVRNYIDNNPARWSEDEYYN